MLKEVVTSFFVFSRPEKDDRFPIKNCEKMPPKLARQLGGQDYNK